MLLYHHHRADPWPQLYLEVGQAVGQPGLRDRHGVGEMGKPGPHLLSEPGHVRRPGEGAHVAGQGAQLRHPQA